MHKNNFLLTAFWKFLIGCVCFFSACNGCVKRQEPKGFQPIPEEVLTKPDLPRVPIQRFERDFFSIKESALDDTTKLKTNYKDFYNLYIRKILGLRPEIKGAVAQGILQFVNDRYMREVYESVQTTFPQLDSLEMQLGKAFSIYKHFFPDSIIPELVSVITGFQYNIISSEQHLAIGLDMYLGRNAKYYEYIKMPLYKIQNMHPGMIATDAIRGFALSTFPLVPRDLLDHMIYHGKIIYFIATLLPDIKEETRLGYTAEQLQWCYTQEKEIWKLFVDKALFYNTETQQVINFIQDGPFTPGFPKTSPSRIGIWLGYRIVSSYMAKYPDISLSQLMLNTDYREIFQKSNYKPTKSA